MYNYNLLFGRNFYHVELLFRMDCEAYIGLGYLYILYMNSSLDIITSANHSVHEIL